MTRLLDELGPLVVDVERTQAAVDRDWQRCREKLKARLGGAAALQSLLRGVPTIVLAEGGYKTANRVAVARAAARGQKVAGDVTHAFSPLTWYAPWLPEPLRTVGLQAREFEPPGVKGITDGVDSARRRQLPDALSEAMRAQWSALDQLEVSTPYDVDALALGDVQVLLGRSVAGFVVLKG
ncbi:hypothetical protein, partial [Actinopolymorpha pittospori]|uniref:hypothetical protein n=1 Tax=Actinopolymorpha pittospori TaxID=648752 RepID=UPI0031EF2AFF